MRTCVKQKTAACIAPPVSQPELVVFAGFPDFGKRGMNYQRIYDNSINFKTKIFRRFRNKKTSKKIEKMC